MLESVRVRVRWDFVRRSDSGSRFPPPRFSSKSSPHHTASPESSREGLFHADHMIQVRPSRADIVHSSVRLLQNSTVIGNVLIFRCICSIAVGVLTSRTHESCWAPRLCSRVATLPLPLVRDNRDPGCFFASSYSSDDYHGDSVRLSIVGWVSVDEKACSVEWRQLATTTGSNQCVDDHD
jgi:hypothetical protein